MLLSDNWQMQSNFEKESQKLYEPVMIEFFICCCKSKMQSSNYLFGLEMLPLKPAWGSVTSPPHLTLNPLAVQ